MDANGAPEPLPASLDDVAAVLIVRHLDDHLPEVVVRCLVDSYRRLGGCADVADQRVRDAERLTRRRLRALATGATAAPPPAWRASPSRAAP